MQSMQYCAQCDGIALHRTLSLQVLRQAALLLKPGGKVLLLEHGQGTWDWINDKINNTADSHYKTYGCWYNRDILGIVEKSGLQVESVSRPWSHFGTTYIIVASPKPEPVATAA
jgi:methyltransferase OMS1